MTDRIRTGFGRTSWALVLAVAAAAAVRGQEPKHQLAWQAVTANPLSGVKAEQTQPSGRRAGQPRRN